MRKREISFLICGFPTRAPADAEQAVFAVLLRGPATSSHGTSCEG